MPIPDEDIAKVRAATDLAALVGEYSSLKRVGRRLQGLCPFHQEKTASFSVNPEQGLYYCYGCRASGDVISFLRATEGLDFVEAVERLAARAGIAIRRDAEGGTAARVDRERRQAMLDAMASAVSFYHERLLSHHDAGAARQYLRSRGYDGEIVRRFKLGWAPPGWDQLSKSLGKPGRVLRETGLAFESSAGRLQDSFRGRIIFPIFDTSGRAIALGGRILPGGEGPKYKNSPETPIYSKRRTLYALNWAKVDLVHSGEVVICEGYTDVIGFYTAGVPRAVATCGTSLTDEHLKVLGGFARRVVLAFDADSAGQSAADRIYDAEKRHGFEVAVASFPTGTDPGDLAQRDKAALAECVSNAIPYLAFRVDRALSAEDLRIPEGRARAAEAALEAIVEHPNVIVRDQYILEVADRTRIPPDQMRDLAAKIAARPKQTKGDERRRVTGERAPRTGRRPGPPTGSHAPARAATAATATGAATATATATTPAPRPRPPEDPSSAAETGGGRTIANFPDDEGGGGGSPVKEIANFDTADETATAPEEEAARRRPEPSAQTTDERGKAHPPSQASAPSARRGPIAERDALSLAVHHPQEMAPYLHEALFSDQRYRDAYLALAAAPSLHAAIDAAEPSTGDLLRQVTVSPETSADVAGTILNLCCLAGRRAMPELERDGRLAAAAGDSERMAEIHSTLNWLHKEIGAIEAVPIEGARPDLAEPLLGWLVRRHGEEL
jgi:DNA primase